MSIIIVKLGGSLLYSSTLQHWLDSIQRLSMQYPVVVVPGGGVFANNIRKLQQKFSLDGETAHQMALLAMSQYAYLLKGLHSDFHVIEDSREISFTFNHKFPLVWLPTCLINDFSEIPASWDFTSDSIALWLAIKLNAERLILVKSEPIDGEQDIRSLIQMGKIDKGFQLLIGKFMGDIFWLEKSKYDCLYDCKNRIRLLS